jgi:hypothetical protein
MGKTVPSYRMVVEWEIDRWNGFRDALPSEEEKEAFDELMDMCGKYASESSSCATNPIISEPMLMSILLSQQRKIRSLEKLKAVTQPANERNG